MSNVSFTPEQLAAMNLSAMTPEQLAAIFGTSAPAPNGNGRAPKSNKPLSAVSLAGRGELAAGVKALDEWANAQTDGSIKAQYMPMGRHGLRPSAKNTRTQQILVKSLRLKLNVAYATGKSLVLSEQERSAVHKFADVNGIAVSGYVKDQPWNLALRVKKDGTPDKRAGTYFAEGGTVQIGRDNVVTFKHSRAKKFAEMQAAAASTLE